MVCAKNFTENQDVINHINFTPDGYFFKFFIFKKFYLKNTSRNFLKWRFNYCLWLC